MNNTLLETIEKKKDLIRKNAMEYFILNQNKSKIMKSHCVNEDDVDSDYQYIPIESFHKEITYNNFEKIIRP